MKFFAVPAEGNIHARAGEVCRGALEVHLRGLRLTSFGAVCRPAGRGGNLLFFALFTDSIKLIISTII